MKATFLSTSVNALLLVLFRCVRGFGVYLVFGLAEEFHCSLMYREVPSDKGILAALRALLVSIRAGWNVERSVRALRQGVRCGR